VESSRWMLEWRWESWKGRGIGDRGEGVGSRGGCVR